MLQRRYDNITQSLFDRAQTLGIETGLERLERQESPCAFGQLGSCCRMCYMGPCRIDPFGNGSQRGVCGATVDTIVSRNLLREEVGGAASHAGHARHVVLTFKKMLEGRAPGYRITDREKLMEVARGLGIETEGCSDEEIGLEVADKALEDFTRQDDGILNWMRLRAPEKAIRK